MRTILALAAVCGLIALAVTGRGLVNPEEDLASGESSLLFVADTGGHSDAYSDISSSLSERDWDLVVLAVEGNDTTTEFRELLDASAAHRMLHSPSPAADSLEVLDVGDLTVVIVDKRPDDPNRCRFSTAELAALRDAVAEGDSAIAVLSDYAFWKGIDPSTNSADPVLDADALTNCPGSESVIEAAALVVSDREALFASRGGGGVYDRTSGTTRFLLLGTPSREDSAALKFARIGVTRSGLTVGEMSQANPNLQDPSVYEHLRELDFDVDEGQMRHLLNVSPFYDRTAGWVDLLEDRDFDLPDVEGTLVVDGVEYEVTLRTRGSFGNHWADVKKSWTVDIEEPGIEGRTQLKLILPYDRLYMNQLFVQEVNRSPALNVLSPDQSVVRVTINGRDFGPYLLYEDFDKAFVELGGFNSDAQRAGLLYRDFFGLYNIWDDLNFIEASKNRQDKSRFVPALDVPTGYEAFRFAFEPANYRDWVASQIFTGDPHQNAQNNTRFFVDLATGRYIMVSWDQFFARIESEEDLLNLHGTSFLQFEILEHESAEVFAVVSELLADAPRLRSALLDLNSSLVPVFVNDPYLTHTEARIQSFADALRENFDNNVRVLSEHVGSD